MNLALLIVPICSLGGSRSPCMNSQCSLGAGIQIANGGPLATPQILSSCSWTPTLNSDNCVSEEINKCNGIPQCVAATCESDSNGTSYWDNTVCNKDCASLNQSQCPGGFLECSGGPGQCTLIGDSCSWICPINPCQNSSGYPLCQSPAPEGTPFDGCLSWNRRCIVSNATAFPPVCDWDVQCTEVNQTLTGPCNITDCGPKPSANCSGSTTWAWIRPSGVGPCQWAFSCSPNLTLSAPCSDEECTSPSIWQSRNTTVCGINPTAKPVCVRNSQGVCQNLTPCYPVYQPPACQISPCGDVCYDPRWLSGEQIGPDSFNASLTGVPIANCSQCLRSCTGFLLCGRPTSNPICQFSQSDAYNQCVSRCTSTPVPFPAAPVNQSTQCSGHDPCQCNYTECTFVTVQYAPGKIYSACLSSEQADNACSLPGYDVLYSSVSLPAYCQFVNSTNSSGPVNDLINRVLNCSSDTLQKSLLNSTNNFTNYIIQISTVLAPSINTSSNWTSLTNSSNSISSPSNSSNSTLVDVGVVVSVHGDEPPPNSTVDEMCKYILQNVIAPNINVSTSQMGSCNLTPVRSTSASSLYSKRSVQNTQFSGTWIFSSTCIVRSNSMPLTQSLHPNATVTVTVNPTSISLAPSGTSGLVCSVVLIVVMMMLIFF
jgi:hypothetical protein